MSDTAGSEIHTDVPESFETERFLIRRPQASDAPAVNAAIHESFDRLQQWFPWANRLPTMAETEENLQSAEAKYRERSDLRLHVFRKDGEFIGCTGLHRINWDVPRFEIGYWVRTAFEGQGFVREYVQGTADFAFQTLGANRLEIRCDPANVRSARVAERCGFTLEARLRHELCDTSGNLRDTLIYARLR